MTVHDDLVALIRSYDDSVQSDGESDEKKTETSDAIIALLSREMPSSQRTLLLSEYTNSELECAKIIYNYLALKGFLRVLRRFDQSILLEDFDNGLVDMERNENTFHCAAKCEDDRFSMILFLLSHFEPANETTGAIMNRLFTMENIGDETPLYCLFEHLLRANGQQQIEQEYIILRMFLQDTNFLWLSIAAMYHLNSIRLQVYDDMMQMVVGLENDNNLPRFVMNISDMIRVALDDIGWLIESDDESDDDSVATVTDTPVDPFPPPPVLSDEVRTQLDIAIGRRQQQTIITLLRDNPEIPYAIGSSLFSGLLYFNTFIDRSLILVVLASIEVLESEGDITSGRLNDGLSSPFHHAADSSLFSRLLTILIGSVGAHHESRLGRILTSYDNEDTTPLMSLFDKINGEFMEYTANSDDDAFLLQQRYDSVKDFLTSTEGQLFLRLSFGNDAIITRYHLYQNDLQEAEDEAELEVEDDEKLSKILKDCLPDDISRNLSNELNAVGNYAELNTYYTLNEFRTLQTPQFGRDKLTFHIEGKDVDCDIGDAETSKYIPVKIDVQHPARSGEWISRHNWDKDGDGKLYIFCAIELKEYLNTHTGTYGLGVHNGDTYYENNAFNDTNPFNRKTIVGVQYLSKDEITEEEGKYSLTNSKMARYHIRIAPDHMKKFATVLSEIQQNKRLIKEREQDKKTYEGALKTLADTPMLTMLRRRLQSARDLLAEEEAKDRSQFNEREIQLWEEEVTGARNRIDQLKAMIKREEEKLRIMEEERLMREEEEIKRKIKKKEEELRELKRIREGVAEGGSPKKRQKNYLPLKF